MANPWLLAISGEVRAFQTRFFAHMRVNPDMIVNTHQRKRGDFIEISSSKVAHRPFLGL